MPLLMIACGVDIHAAIGTSFAIMLPVTIIAGTKNAVAGTIAWEYVPLIVLFAVIGAWFGAKISIGMDAVLLRRLFALMLFVISLKLFFMKS